MQGGLGHFQGLGAAGAPAGLGDVWRPGHTSTFLRDLSRVYIYGDIVWTVDAAVYLLAWARDSLAWEADAADGAADGAADDAFAGLVA